jgi:hypothetical protein
VHLFAGIGICVAAACSCADLGRIRLFLELKNELRKEIGGERATKMRRNAWGKHLGEQEEQRHVEPEEEIYGIATAAAAG